MGLFKKSFAAKPSDLAQALSDKTLTLEDLNKLLPSNKKKAEKLFQGIVQEYSETALHMALRSRQSSVVVERLIQVYSRALTTFNAQGDLPSHVAACHLDETNPDVGIERP